MYPRPARFKRNQRRLRLKPENFAPNQISDTDMKKVEALKKAVSEGNYTVPAEDLAPKLMVSMFRNTILDEAPNGASGFQLEADDQAALEVNGGEIVSRNDLRSASAVPSDGPPGGRGPKRESRYARI
jgi:hypothetical protein